MSQAQLPLHRLPLPPTTLQQSLPRLALADQPSAQRRSTTFPTSTPGVWARVNPLWAAWPLRLTKEEALELGVDVDKGQQISVEDVLRRWNPVDVETKSDNGLSVASSKHRLKLDPILLGISEGALKESLPHLDVGDAVQICNPTSATSSSAGSGSEAREALVDIFSGRKVVQGNKSGTEYGPWSTRYVGHQFGVWAGQLGDGRAISLLETVSEGGGRQEIQLKGAGRTPFSRTADGLAVLRSGVREFLGCEAIAALAIPTTRSLALLTTPLPSLPVIREQGPEPTSLLCRLAPSFIRIGHFQALNPGKEARNMRQFYLGGSGWLNDQSEINEKQGNLDGLRQLTEWVKGDIMQSEGSTKDWFEDVVRRNAETVAAWQVYGWMHGVLNTDNISPLGLTIDYGPYAFMDVFDNDHICNHSDPSGLYSYRAQPGRVLFALDKLSVALAPIIGYEAVHSTSAPPPFGEDVEQSQVDEWEKKGLEVLGKWDEVYWSIEREAERQGWLKRFGLKTFQKGDDRFIVADYLRVLSSHSLDFHSSFRLLSSLSPTRALNDEAYLSEFSRSFVKGSSTALPVDQVEKAQGEVAKWVEVYARRASEEEERSAWVSSSTSTSTSISTSSANGSDGETPSWEGLREKGMTAANPRFVLRQWVLEELIGKMESSLTRVYVDASKSETSEDGEPAIDQAKVEEGIVEARKELAKILEMSTRPFEPWGEGEMPSDIENGTQADQEDWLERRRLCGLGKKEMLGFQCSCSS